MADEKQISPSKRGWMKIVLVSSLAVNLLVVGIVAGAFLKGPPGHDRNPALRELGFSPFVRAMSGADQKTLLDEVKGRNKPGRDNRAEIRAKFQAILGALRADPFDSTDLENLIDQTRVGVHTRQEEIQNALIEQIKNMDSETRSAYADQLEKMLKRGGNRRR